MAIRDEDLLDEMPCGKSVLAEVGGPFLVAFSGELDIAIAADIRDRLVREQVIDAPAVCIDLTAATFIDSSAIGILVSACKRIRASGGNFAVRCVRPSTIWRTLEVAGLIEYLEVNGSA